MSGNTESNIPSDIIPDDAIGSEEILFRNILKRLEKLEVK